MNRTIKTRQHVRQCWSNRWYVGRLRGFGCRRGSIAEACDWRTSRIIIFTRKQMFRVKPDEVGSWSAELNTTRWVSYDSNHLYHSRSLRDVWSYPELPYSSLGRSVGWLWRLSMDNRLIMRGYYQHDWNINSSLHFSSLSLWSASCQVSCILVHHVWCALQQNSPSLRSKSAR